MTPKPHNSQAKQSATPAGGTSQKHAFHAMSELFKKDPAAGDGSGGAPRLLSTKHILNSGHSFNENNKLTSSRLNTKTNAQVTNQKIVTPKATMANDPDARNKILEKLLQSAAHLNEQNNNTEQKGKQSEVEVVNHQSIQLGGAFTKKLKQNNSSKDNEEAKDIDKKEENDTTSFNGQGTSLQKEADKEKESHGQLQGADQLVGPPLDLNAEPLSSLYTGAPDALKTRKEQTSGLGAEKGLLSGSKQHSTAFQAQIQTPLLGGKIIETEYGNEEESPRNEPKTKGFNLGNDSDVKDASKSK